MTETEQLAFSLDCRNKYEKYNPTEIQTQRVVLEGVKMDTVKNMRSILYKTKGETVDNNISLLYIFADLLLKTQIELEAMDFVICEKT